MVRFSIPLHSTYLASDDLSIPPGQAEVDDRGWTRAALEAGGDG